MSLLSRLIPQVKRKAESFVALIMGEQLVSASNPLPVTQLPPTTATDGTAAAIAAVDAAPDRAQTPAYFDPGTVDQRFSAVVVSSASLGLSYTETFTYDGSAGNYRIATQTRS